MLIDEPTLQQVTTEVCESMLGLAMSVVQAPCAVDEPLVASIRISGDCNSLLEVEASRRMSALIAAAMFAKQPGEVAADEVCDALAEVANMIGGNVKGIVPGESYLSLPCVGPRRSESEPPLGDCFSVVPFQVDGEPLTIRLRTILPGIGNGES